MDHYQKKSKDEFEYDEAETEAPSDDVIKDIRQRVSLINKGILVDIVGVEESVNGGETMFTVKCSSLLEIGGCPHFANIKLRFSPQSLAKFLAVTKKAASK